MAELFNTLIYYLLKAFCFIFNRIPLSLRLKIFRFLVGIAFVLVPRLKAVSMVNLSLAFPESTAIWRNEIFRQSLDNLARILVDIFRIAELDQKWVDSNVEFPGLQRLTEIRNNSSCGVLYLSGHLGSFELLTVFARFFARPLAFIARPLKPEGLFRWWQSVRTCHGSELIYRKGSVRHVIKHLKAGKDVGILFDQNVTRDQAVFVDWFGRPAATTRIVPLLTMSLNCPLVVVSVQGFSADRYRLNMKEIDYQDIIKDPSLSDEQKAFRITERASNAFLDLVRLSPGEWFWFHRRWKTAITPGEGERLYKSVEFKASADKV